MVLLLNLASNILFFIDASISFIILLEIKNFMFQAISEYMGKPFWEQPLSMWDTVNNVGLR